MHLSLHWRHNVHDSVSNHQPRDCLLNRLLRRRSKKTSKLRVTGLCAGNSPGTGEFPHKWPVTRKMFPFDDVIMMTLLTSLVCQSRSCCVTTNHISLQKQGQTWSAAFHSCVMMDYLAPMSICLWGVSLQLVSSTKKFLFYSILADGDTSLVQRNAFCKQLVLKHRCTRAIKNSYTNFTIYPSPWNIIH